MTDNDAIMLFFPDGTRRHTPISLIPRSQTGTYQVESHTPLLTWHVVNTKIQLAYWVLDERKFVSSFQYGYLGEGVGEDPCEGFVGRNGPASLWRNPEKSKTMKFIIFCRNAQEPCLNLLVPGTVDRDTNLRYICSN